MTTPAQLHAASWLPTTLGWTGSESGDSSPRESLLGRRP